jgi:hypothetical protein
MPFHLVVDARNLERINYWKTNSNPPGCKYGQRSGPPYYGPKGRVGVPKCPKICKNGWARDVNNQCTNPNDNFVNQLPVLGIGNEEIFVNQPLGDDFQNGNNQGENNDLPNINFDEIINILEGDQDNNVNNGFVQDERLLPNDDQELLENDPLIPDIDEEEIPQSQPVIDVGKQNPFSKQPNIETVETNSSSISNQPFFPAIASFFQPSMDFFSGENPLRKRSREQTDEEVLLEIDQVYKKITEIGRGVNSINQKKSLFDMIDKLCFDKHLILAKTAERISPVFNIDENKPPSKKTKSVSIPNIERSRPAKKLKTSNPVSKPPRKVLV